MKVGNIECTLALTLPTNKHPKFARVHKSVWCFSDGDFDAAASLIDEHDWDFLKTADIDAAWSAFKSTFLEIMSKCIPKKEIYIRPSIPWLNTTLLRKIRKRNYYFQRSKYFRSQYYITKYKQLRNELVKDLRAAKSAYLLSIC